MNESGTHCCRSGKAFQSTDDNATNSGSFYFIFPDPIKTPEQPRIELETIFTTLRFDHR